MQVSLHWCSSPPLPSVLTAVEDPPKRRSSSPVEALTRSDVCAFILCCLGLCCNLYISLLPCGQLLMSPCLFKKSLPLSIPPLLCHHIFCLLQPRLRILSTRRSPCHPCLRPANWFFLLCAVSAGLPQEERSCRRQTVCGRACCRGEPRSRSITQASSWARWERLCCWCCPPHTLMTLSAPCKDAIIGHEQDN